jgi:4-hydroxybenzoate polyprenyltransferase
MSRFRALLATLRIANAPSVVSNVWLGFMVGWIQSTKPPYLNFDAADWRSVLVAASAAVLLYFAGNLANDWFDREWDKLKRPERALPAGKFQPNTYLAAAIGCGLLALLLCFSLNVTCGICGVLIATLIFIYTRYHKQAMWAVVPMGACRAGLYFLGYFVTVSDWIWDQGEGAAVISSYFTYLEWISTLAIGIFCYIAGLSLSARYEGMENPPQGPRVISWALIAMPLLAMSCHLMARTPTFGIVGTIPFAVWLTLCLTLLRKPIPRYVSGLLAGIPLVDFIAAAPLALGALTFVDRFQHEGAPDISHLQALFIIPLAAFVLGRLLQRVAPAT